MKSLYDYGNEFARQSSWKDLVLIKFCLGAMGILLGLAVPKKRRKPVAFFASLLFVASCIPMILKFLGIVQADQKTKKE